MVFHISPGVKKMVLLGGGLFECWVIESETICSRLLGEEVVRNWFAIESAKSSAFLTES